MKQVATSGRRGLYSLDNNNSYAFDNTHDGTFKFFISYSSDQGNTWDRVNEIYLKDIHPDIYSIQKSYMLDKDHYYLASQEYGVIIQTNDGGETFKASELGTFDSDVGDIHMLDPNHGILTDINGITVTHDGWDTWEEFIFPNYEYIIFQQVNQRTDSLYYINCTKYYKNEDDST